MRKLYQPESSVLTVSYAPVETTELLENPPRFTWMPGNIEGGTYCLEVSTSPEFDRNSTRSFSPVYNNFFTPSQIFEPGTYYWRYTMLDYDGEKISREWSMVRSFSLSEELPETPLPDRSRRYEGCIQTHPRLWLNEKELKDFRLKVKDNAQYCAWQEFYDKSVAPWLSKELPAEPLPYPNNQKVIAIWRDMYTTCQEMLCSIRNMSIAAKVLKDDEILLKAKNALMHAAAWNTEGTTSRDYNDEAAFRMVAALAWGYDWLYYDLTDEERSFVLEKLLRRTEQVANHVIVDSKIHFFPYDSHAVRSLSSVLTPCCITMLGEVEAAREWLDYTLEYYSCLYTPWGGKDGGWAEGGAYWTTGMAFMTEAMNLIKKYFGIDFYQRPFFNKTGDFPLLCYSQETLCTSFGDQSELGKKPGLKTGFNVRQFAGATGNGFYQWYFEKVKERNKSIDQSFFNSGWWDFYFDEMVYQHDYPKIKAVPPKDIQPVKWFRDVGWVAFHKNMESSEEHVMLLTKSSPYGSVSHSHGDQNSFLLHAYGEPLAIESGYYVGFGTTMHKNWRRQTLSQNNILIDGKGQYAGMDKTLQLAAKGLVEKVENLEDYCYVRENSTAAYLNQVPYLKSAVREIYFVNQSYFVILDQVSLEKPGKIDWLIHAFNKMELSGQSFRIVGEKADLFGNFIYNSTGNMSLSQNDEFPEVDPSEYEGLTRQWHMKAETKETVNHNIITLLLPLHKGEERYVSTMVDDQGHDVSVYFTDNGQTFMLHVEKNF